MKPAHIKQQSGSKRRRVLRRHAPGANLAVLAVVALMLIAFLGVSIYTGLQAYVQNEIQKAASTAAMAGAAAYYSSVGAGGIPAPNPGMATSIATSTFNSILANSGGLKGFNTTLMGVSTGANDTVTVEAKGSMATGFLAPVGISQIEVTALGTARALKYMIAGPGTPVGPISILPDGTLPSMQRTIELAFPLVDSPGTDLYLQQAMQAQYVVEACNNSECYDLGKGATVTGTGMILDNPLDGSKSLMGSVTIDLEKAGVRKASKIRITHSNLYVSRMAGASDYFIQTSPTPLIVDTVQAFGYSGACVTPSQCAIPAGFAPVQ